MKDVLYKISLVVLIIAFVFAVVVGQKRAYLYEKNSNNTVNISQSISSAIDKIVNETIKKDSEKVETIDDGSVSSNKRGIITLVVFAIIISALKKKK